MKVMTFNVRVWTRDTDKESELHWKTRAKKICKFIERERPDVICFQELSFPMNLTAIPSGYKKLGCSASHHIYIKKEMTGKAGGFHIHYNSATVEGVTIVCVHGKWTAKVTDGLCEALNQFTNKPHIICGDFNIGAESLNNHGFKTVRQLLNLETTPTFKNYKSGSTGEIDHYISDKVCLGYRIYPDDTMSDHYAVIANFFV